MANFIIEDIKNAWNKRENGLIKIILINIIVFVSISVVQVVLTISGLSTFFTMFINKLMLPASLGTFILHHGLNNLFLSPHSFMHILWNMLFLYWFGKIIYDNIGNNALISLYVLGIIGGLFTWLFIILFLTTLIGCLSHLC